MQRCKNKIYGRVAGEGKMRWAGVKIKQKSEEYKGCKAVEVKEEQRLRCEMGAGHEVRVQLRAFGTCVGGCMRV